MGKAALVAAAGLLALCVDPAPGAHAMTLAELAKASAVFSDMTQQTLQFTASAERRIGQANAEMDVQAEGAFERIEGHLQAARQHLQQARTQVSKLGQVYQSQVAKERRGRTAPAPSETEEDRRIVARYGEAYREAETRSERAFERAKFALIQAEERFLALKKTAGSSPGN